jgi:peptidoglycan/xylan/chitin deacetylase (PgdA/CDA1 family)
MILNTLIRMAGSEKLSVFLFHKVPSLQSSSRLDDVDFVEFNRVVDLVQSQFQIIPLEDAVKFSPSSLPKNAACLTFDDGYAEWMTGVIPELMRRGLHATFFITTGQLSGKEMWHERIISVFERYYGDSIDLCDFGLPKYWLRTDTERKEAFLGIEAHLKYQSLQFREEVFMRIESIVGDGQVSTKSLLTSQDIREIHNKGFTIGAHTINHPILRVCDPQIAFQEIGGAKEELESIICAPVSTFAYPNGHPYADFAEEHIRMVQKVGFDCAVTTQPGAWSPNECKWQIPRFTPWGPDRSRMKLQILRNIIYSPNKIKLKN